MAERRTRWRTKDIPEDAKLTVYVDGIGYRGTQGIESTEQRYMPFGWVGASNIAEHVKAGIGIHYDSPHPVG